MSEDVSAVVAGKLNEVGPSVAVALEFSMSAYFDVLRGLVDNFAREKGLQCIYITSAVPARTIQGTLEALEIDPSGISFVDTISQMIMEKMERENRSIIYVESPTVLENVVLKVDYLTRKLDVGPKLVVVDSINSLAIHNDAKMLSEFLHADLRAERQRGVSRHTINAGAAAPGGPRDAHLGVRPGHKSKRIIILSDIIK